MVLAGDSNTSMGANLGMEGPIFTRMKTNQFSMKTFQLAALAWVMFGSMVTTAWGQWPCEGDSLALQVVVSTDAWGYEAYWELLPVDGACGTGDALVWGGNPDVGCGPESPGLPSEVLPNNVVVTSETVCVADGDSLTLFHRDSYGDGGTNFSLTVYGIEVATFSGTDGGNEWDWEVVEPAIATGDVPCFSESIVANGDHWMGSNVEATVSPMEPAPAGIGCGTYGGWCEGGLSNTVWLNWQVPEEGGVYWVTTCNEFTTFDTQMALWRTDDCADWSSFELLNSNDDIGCSFGSFRSGFLTPCLEGGEVLFLQIDGYYGETGDLDVSIESSSPDAWFVNAGAVNLSCNLDGGFNPDGRINVNTNVGPASVDWNWTGPFGFTSNDASIGPLLPGIYELEAQFCGVTQSQSIEVLEPESMSLDVELIPSCELGAMQGLVNVAGGQGELQVVWQSSDGEFEGSEVTGLPPGLCEVLVTDEQGCEATDLVLVDEVGVPEVDLGADLFGCVGDAFTLLAPLGNGLSYTWSTGQEGPLVTIVPDEPGTLVVGVEVMDMAGCADTDVVILTIDDCAAGLSAVSGPSTSMFASPNPFGERLWVSSSAPMSASDLLMFNALGDAVEVEWSAGDQGWRLETSMTPGVYVLMNRLTRQTIRLVAQ